jgi:hypothetical protein
MTVTITNLVLTVLLLLLGIWAYARTKTVAALLIGLAFGILAISHLLTLLDLATSLSTLLLIIRITGYLVAIAAVIRLGTLRPSTQK